MSTWNIGNGATNINIGRVGDGDGDATATQNVNANAEAVKKSKPLFDGLINAVPEVERPQVESDVMRPLMTFAALPPAEMTPEVEATSKTLIERLRPYSEKLGAVVAAFGEGALSAMASSNPIINGLLFAVRAWNQPSYPVDPWNQQGGGSGWGGQQGGNSGGSGWAS